MNAINLQFLTNAVKAIFLFGITIFLAIDKAENFVAAIENKIKI